MKKQGRSAIDVVVFAVIFAGIIAVISYSITAIVVRQEVHRELLRLGMLRGSTETQTATSQTAECTYLKLYIPKVGIRNITICSLQELSYLSKCMVAIHNVPSKAAAEKIWNQCSAYIMYATEHSR